MTNRLARSQSLYLRKHAENPIDWHPWGEEALDKASRENKPIFLSIGYSSCHWCTVMEGEAFSDWAIADYMNQFFVPIKVDREERPDLDSIYMQALQMMTGQGGWPLNVFLTPDDRLPFYGGTYFPLDPKYGRPGFLQILQAIRQFYDTEADKLRSRKETILAQLEQGTRLQPGEELSEALLYKGLIYSAGIISASGMGQSFPMIPYAEAALRATRFDLPESRYDAAAACKQRGLHLALGGIFDHVGGGFHRYTVDPTWTVPHFEKMLYDNGQIVEFLADLWAAGVEEPAFEQAIARTVSWLQREMLAPQGYFYAAQDADSFVTADDAEPEEGAFYVWSYAELQNNLSEAELAHLADYFFISESGNFEGQIVLQRRTTELGGAEIAAILTKLFALRYGHATLDRFPPACTNQQAKTTAWDGRIPPVTDTKMIVAWNSLMISGLARSAAVFQAAESALATDCLNLATQAAQFILDNQWIEGRFHRLNYDGQPAVLAQSEDYALFIKALIDLDQALLAVQTDAEAHLTATVWLQHALRVQEEFDEFLSSLEGGYYNTDARSDLVVRERSYDDNATPSANGVAIANLVRLACSSEDLSYLDRAEQALRSFSGIMEQTPQVCPTLFVALDWFRNHTVVRTSAAVIRQLSADYLPTAVYTIEPALPAGAVGLVCEGLSCREPAQSIEQLREQLDQLQARE